MISDAEYRRTWLMEEKTFSRLSEILTLSEEDLRKLHFTIDENSETNVLIFTFDMKSPVEILNKIELLRKDNIVALRINDLMS
jgi:hypothetical protein